MKKNLLITGGLGFIGSNFLKLIIKNKNINCVVVDKLTYASNERVLNVYNKYENFKFLKFDICNANKINNLFNEIKFNHVINFAAESHVDNSIKNPNQFFKTNILGVVNLANAALAQWGMGSKKNGFLQVSTDEVYGDLKSIKSKKFNESSMLLPNSPYSSSKASAELILRSYYKTFGMQVTITNCTNNFGPYQNKEKIIPKIINSLINGKKIPIYGDGKNVRDWIFVNDHCEVIIKLLKKFNGLSKYNIGQNNEINNIELVNIIYIHLKKIIIKDTYLLKKFPKFKHNIKSKFELINFVKDRMGHDFRYAVDSNLLYNKLNIKLKNNFSQNLTKTLNWYLLNE